MAIIQIITKKRVLFPRYFQASRIAIITEIKTDFYTNFAELARDLYFREWMKRDI